MKRKVVKEKGEALIAPPREHFVFTDTEGIVYHLMVEGSVIKEGTRIPPDTQTGRIRFYNPNSALLIFSAVPTALKV